MCWVYSFIHFVFAWAVGYFSFFFFFFYYYFFVRSSVFFFSFVRSFAFVIFFFFLVCTRQHTAHGSDVHDFVLLVVRKVHFGLTVSVYNTFFSQPNEN